MINQWFILVCSCPGGIRKECLVESSGRFDDFRSVILLHGVLNGPTEGLSFLIFFVVSQTTTC